MTFEDMMHMKRLGSTAVSPDGKWLAYSVTTVDLDQEHQNNGAVAPANRGWRRPIKLAAAQPGDDGLQFSPDGKRILFSQQPRRRASKSGSPTSTPPPAPPPIRSKLTNLAPRPTTPSGRPTANPSSSPRLSIPTAPQSRRRRPRRRRQVQLPTATRPWPPARSRRRSSPTSSTATGTTSPATSDPISFWSRLRTAESATSPPTIRTTSRPSRSKAAADSPSRPTRRNWPSPRTSTPSRPSAPTPTSSPSTSPTPQPSRSRSAHPGGDFNPAYSPDGKYLAWRSQLRPGYESDKFRLLLYDRAAKTTKDLLPKFDNWVDEFAWAPDSTDHLFRLGQSG